METIYKADPSEEAPLSWWEGAPRQPGFGGCRVGEKEGKEGQANIFFLVENRLISA